MSKPEAVNIDYGRGHLPLIPPLAAEIPVLRKKTLAGDCVLICDTTRPEPNHLFSALIGAGIQSIEQPSEDRGKSWKRRRR